MGYKPYTKNDVLKEIKDNNLCITCSEGELQNFAGSYFEIKFQEKNYAARRPSLPKYPDGAGGFSSPDFVSDNFADVKDWGERGVQLVEHSWYELKAKSGNLYLSSNTYQIKKHINSLSVTHANAISDGYKPRLIIITTHGVKVSTGIKAYASSKSVVFSHLQSYVYEKSGKKFIVFLPLSIF